MRCCCSQWASRVVWISDPPFVQREVRHQLPSQLLLVGALLVVGHGEAVRLLEIDGAVVEGAVRAVLAGEVHARAADGVRDGLDVVAEAAEVERVAHLGEALAVVANASGVVAVAVHFAGLSVVIATAPASREAEIVQFERGRRLVAPRSFQPHRPTARSGCHAPSRSKAKLQAPKRYRVGTRRRAGVRSRWRTPLRERLPPRMPPQGLWFGGCRRVARRSAPVCAGAKGRGALEASRWSGWVRFCAQAASSMMRLRTWSGRSTLLMSDRQRFRGVRSMLCLLL